METSSFGLFQLARSSLIQVPRVRFPFRSQGIVNPFGPGMLSDHYWKSEWGMAMFGPLQCRLIPLV